MATGARSRFVAFVNSPRVAARLLAIVAVACAAGTVVAYGAAVALRDHGDRAVGTVIGVRQEARREYVVVRFSDATGHDITAEVGNFLFDPKPRAGDRVEIVYDPKNPSGNVADVRMGPDFFSVWAFALGGLVAGSLVWPTRTGRLDWNRLR